MATVTLVGPSGPLVYKSQPTTSNNKTEEPINQVFFLFLIQSKRMLIPASSYSLLFFIQRIHQRQHKRGKIHLPDAGHLGCFNGQGQRLQSVRSLNGYI